MTFDLQAAREICDKLTSWKDAVEGRANEIENNPNRSWVAESQNTLRKWAMDRAYEQLHAEGKI